MIARTVLVALAIAAALVPLPASMVERWYSRGLYASLQPMATSLSNLVPIALLDVAVAGVLLGWVIRLSRLDGWKRRLRWTAGALMTTAAVVYLLFALLWGFNYRRMRLEEKLAYDASRVNKAALIKLANQSIGQLNTLYTQGHGTVFSAATVEDAVVRVQRDLGDAWTFRSGVPKRSVLSWYFRQAAIDGMTDPFFLEIILNTDLLAFERPMVLAHEWAHLAGYAHESEANFVAWLACLRSDVPARYSAWLSTYGHAVSRLSRDDRRQLLALDAGPREDLRAMVARYARSRPAVRRASREVYDSYLKANRVEEGIESYSAVLRLMLGTEFPSDGTPRLRLP